MNLSDVNFDTKNSNFVNGLFSHDVTLIDINPDFSPNNVFSYRSTKKLLCTQPEADCTASFHFGTVTKCFKLKQHKLGHRVTSRIHSFHRHLPFSTPEPFGCYFLVMQDKKKREEVLWDQNRTSMYCPPPTCIGTRPTRRTNDFSVLPPYIF